MRETLESSRLQHEESFAADGGQRHECCIFCRAQKVRRVTEDSRDFLNAANVVTGLSGASCLTRDWVRDRDYPVCYVIEMHRGELEDR